ncbi:MAG: hypothetical protein A2071_10105 [Bacteroidetes bacterium GWC1_47_7]|nr:MAG: hypothetical protein A2071_10105 [Bacteroidetes bacterium GWC1_47_7]
MIKIAADMEEDDKKDHLLKMLLSQMKRSYTQWNKEADDEKIFHDLNDMSDGRIKMSTDTHSIPDVKLNNNSRDKLKNIKYQRKK